MYETLIEWCVFPVNVHRFVKVKPSGDKEYAEATVEKGYRVDEVRNITDKTGAVYTSYSHVYFPATVAMSADDCLSFPDDTRQREVRKLGGFYDGTTGELSIRVVYL